MLSNENKEMLGTLSKFIGRFNDMNPLNEMILITIIGVIEAFPMMVAQEVMENGEKLKSGQLGAGSFSAIAMQKTLAILAENLTECVEDAKNEQL